MRFSLLFIFFISCHFLSAQEEPNFKYSFALGESNERLHGANGIHGRLIFNFTPNFIMPVEYTHYFQVVETRENESVEHDTRMLMLNLQYHIRIGERLRFSFYPTIGINVTNSKEVTVTSNETFEKYVENTGMNAGFGMAHRFGRFTPYIEGRNLFLRTTYLLFSAGVSYSFGKY